MSYLVFAQVPKKVPQDGFPLVSFQNELQLLLGSIFAHGAQERPPGPLVRRVAVDDHAIQVEDDCLQHARLSFGECTPSSSFSFSPAMKTGLRHSWPVYRCPANRKKSDTLPSVPPAVAAGENQYRRGAVRESDQ